jgi:hypothetical protein
MSLVENHHKQIKNISLVGPEGKDKIKKNKFFENYKVHQRKYSNNVFDKRSYKDKVSSQNISFSRGSSNEKKKTKYLNIDLYTNKNMKGSLQISQDLDNQRNLPNIYKLKSDRFIPDTTKKSMQQKKMFFDGQKRKRKTFNQSSSVKSESVNDNSNNLMGLAVYTNTDYNLRKDKETIYYSPISDELSNNFNPK